MTAATLRRLPVPVSEPYPSNSPERRPTVPPTQGALALRFSAAQAGTPPEDPWLSPQPTPSQDLPDPEGLCRALVQAVVEVLSGARHPTQLVRWLTGDVYAALQRRVALAARLGRPAGTAQTRRPVVTSVRTSAPADGVVEASAVVVDRGRVRAVALRLEGLDRRWRVTALEIG